MHCSEAEPQLVAWQDGELSPSANHQLEEHLDRCAPCRTLAERLAASTPAPFHAPPNDVQARLEAALNVDAILAAADRRGPLTHPFRLPRWLREETEISRMTILAYAAILALTFGWGVANWSQTPLGIAGVQPVPAGLSSEIPADQFAPASYTPKEEADLP